MAAAVVSILFLMEDSLVCVPTVSVEPSRKRNRQGRHTQNVVVTTPVPITERKWRLGLNGPTDIERQCDVRNYATQKI
jgi:hypothetical protein